jgi:RimJ/RimL family protein N-acetyltransferase
MEIITERLIIRCLKPEDKSAFIEMASDGSLHEIFGDCRECGKWMGGWIQEAIQFEQENNPKKDYLAYAVVNKKDGIVIGSVGCSYYQDLGETGLTYFIGSAYRRQGFALEAAKAYTDYFLKNYNTDRITAAAKADNPASCKTLERVGFRLLETRQYQDINDDAPHEYCFYEMKK